MLLVLLFAWQVLVRIFPSTQPSITLRIDSTFKTSRPAVIFYVTAALTIGLWLTEPLHHIKSSVVGFLPVVILLATRVFSTKDLQSVQWHVLWLVAGGIALGVGVSHSGFDDWLIGLVRWEAIGAAWITLALALLALIMSTVISNSATANLLIPIGLSLATSGVVDLPPLMAGFFIAIGASLAMSLPISTPPNAIAYSTGAIRTQNMALVGVLVGAFGLLVFVLLSPLLWRLFGLPLG
jgi:sodium-dependent dicarboxylate transporter 2/3/5